MTLTPEDMKVLFQVVSITAFVSGVTGYVGGFLFGTLMQVGVDWLRRRGARAPFVERAEAFERRARRWAAAHSRIAARNRREAIRRGDWVDEV
ncbi:hypothetical protein [Variovorax sp. 54]|uniref:hypothetical protein n=1 Tax=Variovorax sp. 54 TaxID=2035212 RepID=UPI0011802C3A|nr:hypothetical protein [Variovorax sp. 54]